MDTRRLQHFLGHASITNTVRCTAMSPEHFYRYLEMSTQLDEAKTELEAAQSVLRRRLKPGTLQTWPRAVLRCRRSLSMSPKKP